MKQLIRGRKTTRTKIGLTTRKI